MLVPAIIYKDEIEKQMKMRQYSDEMLFYNGWLGFEFSIHETSDGNMYEYAIVDKDEVVGFFVYSVDWVARSINSIGLFSFKTSSVIGIDVYKEIKKMIRDYKFHRISWRMVSGNPVEPHYDRFCNRYKGVKHILRDAVVDRYGKYHNDIIYEIIFEA